MTDLQARMGAFADRFETALAARLEGDGPPRLWEAMRHGALGGGKRLRPFLLVESAVLCGAEEAVAMPAALALEMVHCYSLIHDDLPAMDDDDLRRGRPTVHIAYDEATAILAGDALLTLAFETIAEVPALVAPLARASGMAGMIGGQMLDIEAESGAPDAAGIRRLQAMKTGALIRFACEAGAVVGGADIARRDSLLRYGETVGLAFQLADDLLDVTATSEAMGKATGKDAEAGKGTLVGLHGIDAVRGMLDEAVAEAGTALDAFDDAETLRALAQFVARRQS